MSGQKPREIAARVLRDRAGGTYVEALLEGALAEARLSGPDRNLCQELVYGVVRWQATLDWLIQRKTPGRTQKKGLQDLLRLGLYQIFWLDRIPGHAAVHETVELAKQAGFGPQAGFVNAVLRGYLRELEETRQLLLELRQTQPALGYSHPDWLVERWRQRWGQAESRKLLEWNNTPPRTYARVNSLKTQAERLLERWREEGVDYDFFRSPWLPENLVFELKSHPPLPRLKSFQEGWFYVQDPSTVLAVAELNPQPGETILDLCAAPGGKATLIAQRMMNQGQLYASDISRDRLDLLRENCSRLGATCVQPVISTARTAASAGAAEGGPLKSAPEPLPGLPAPSDAPLCHRVLVDAPCSNTGVLRRRVDLRWRIQPEEIQRLRNLQLELLRQGNERLRVGGTLVYSTCSLEPEENGDLVREFLALNPGRRLEHERQLLPFRDGCDGAYVARIA